MSFTAFLVFATVAAAHPPPVPSLTEISDDRTPMRCKPAPYYVAEKDERSSRVERLIITGSRVPQLARDYSERRSRPCFLMRDGAPPNPLRSAD